MHKYTLLFIAFLFSLLVGAQSSGLAVADFQLLADDLTANLHGTTVYDQNGEKCALIKIETTQTGFSFDVGALGVVKVVQNPGEIWLYVPEKIKRITIAHPQLGVLRDYAFSIPIQKARTYLLRLTTGTVTTVVQKTITSQYLQFNVEPREALVEVDGVIWNTTDGVARRFLPFGDYDYRIFLNGYSTEVGKVKVNNPDQKVLVNVKLQPSLGWVEVGDFDELKGAKVYIDDAYVGIAPVKSSSLLAGEHHLRILQSMYHPFDTVISVIPGKTYRTAPYLKPSFVYVTITAPEGTEIWINGEKKALNTWKGKLEDGDYTIEARRDSFRPFVTTYTIDSKKESKANIKLEAPTPIGGKLDVSVLPDGADVYLEDNYVGKTPLFLQKVLAGNRVVTVKKEGYTTQRFEVNVQEGKTANVSGHLTK